jgi:hypothetical protein
VWRWCVDPGQCTEGAKALLSEIVPAIEETIRSYFAKPIAHTENPKEIDC